MSKYVLIFINIFCKLWLVFSGRRLVFPRRRCKIIFSAPTLLSLTNWNALEFAHHLFPSAIHLRKGEQKSEEFTKISPNQTVPVLVVDGRPLQQSLAIIEYLEETHPTPSLFPKYIFPTKNY